MKKVILGAALFIGGAIGFASAIIGEDIIFAGNRTCDSTNLKIICGIIALIGVVLAISGIRDKE